MKVGKDIELTPFSKKGKKYPNLSTKNNKASDSLSKALLFFGLTEPRLRVARPQRWAVPVRSDPNVALKLFQSQQESNGKVGIPIKDERFATSGISNGLVDISTCFRFGFVEFVGFGGF